MNVGPIQQTGAEVLLNGEHVTLRAPEGALGDRLIQQLREHKPDVILALRLERYCAGLLVTPAEVLTCMGDDPVRSWEHAQAVASGMHITRQLRQGIVPEGWTAETECIRCKPAPVSPNTVAGTTFICPWCFHPEGLRKLREAGP